MKQLKLPFNWYYVFQLISTICSKQIMSVRIKFTFMSIQSKKLISVNCNLYFYSPSQMSISYLWFFLWVLFFSIFLFISFLSLFPFFSLFKSLIKWWWMTINFFLSKYLNSPLIKPPLMNKNKKTKRLKIKTVKMWNSSLCVVECWTKLTLTTVGSRTMFTYEIL